MAPEYIEEGIIEVEKYLTDNPKKEEKQIDIIKLYFNSGTNRYETFHVQYKDGSDLNIAS